MRRYKRNLLALVTALWTWSSCLAEAGPADGSVDPYSFDDTPLAEGVQHPDWFKSSFLDLREDLDQALADGKAGVMLYFGQARCPYCRLFFEANLAKPDIKHYVQSRFDVIGLQIFSDEEITDPAGNTLSVREFSIRERTHFTPSVLFYTEHGRNALTLRGYPPPYKFRAALEYVADGHYLTSTFREYLALADPPPVFEEDALAEDELFSAPPYMLDRRRFPADQPLLVVFEQGKCHACDVLHTEPLGDAGVRDWLSRFDVVQLDMWDDRTPLVTPAGARLTPRAWAARLGLFYAPTLVFFDERGREVMRIDSVVQFYRLRGVLQYVHEKGYVEEPIFQRWRRQENLDDAARSASRKD
ncbi:MAG: thioredoxin fold domain-containing protein [Gammaproteobacteria bacterium]|nr:thioredoxin fold domain-containing protein [Gammaproteobacteria bacterium]